MPAASAASVHKEVFPLQGLQVFTTILHLMNFKELFVCLCALVSVPYASRCLESQKGGGVTVSDVDAGFSVRVAGLLSF